MSAQPTRPAVSVLLPFLGDEQEAESALMALTSIALRPGDEIVVADNCPDLVMSAVAGRFPAVTAVAANEQQSAYYARNRAAAAARNEWLLFTDADCTPAPDILDRYFAEPVHDDIGAVAGEVLGDPMQTSLVARYQRDRQYLNQARYVSADRPYAVTANLLVRAAAWKSVGGYLEGVLCDEDTDFTWRLQEAGWRLAYRPEAVVTHRYREDIRAFARMILSYAAGRAWLSRRYSEPYPEPASLASAARALVAAARWALTGQPARARFRAIDGLVIVLDHVGTWGGNAPRPNPMPAVRAVLVAQTFPDLEQPIGNLPEGLVVEAAHRPVRQDLDAVRRIAARYREDDSRIGQLRALGALAARRPLRCLADWLARGRRVAPSPPLHSLAPAALRIGRYQAASLCAAPGASEIALRLSRLAGAPAPQPLPDGASADQ